MQRAFRRFLGVDLGGGKGKTTAVARLEINGEGQLEVVEVGTQSPGKQTPWYDDILTDYLVLHADQAVLAVDAPLTLPACVRCREPICPGMSACVDPAIVWFRTEGEQMIAESIEADRDRIAAIPANGKRSGSTPAAPRAPKPLTTPYTQRATEVVMHRRHGIIPRETLGQGMGPLTARASYLVRALGRSGYALNQNLIEVYPKATIHQLWGRKIARRYKREVETWETRATVLESLRGKLEFAASSRMAREECLQNDHCFDAVICAYTGYLWATEGWTMPANNVFAVDGWIWAPGLT
jgi:predicted nuclease with RNAse H fold